MAVRFHYTKEKTIPGIMKLKNHSGECFIIWDGQEDGPLSICFCEETKVSSMVYALNTFHV